MGLHMVFLLALFCVSSAVPFTKFEDAMRPRGRGDFFLEALEGREAGYSDNGALAAGGGITIEQFVKELKKRKKAKEAQKKKKSVTTNKKVTKTTKVVGQQKKVANKKKQQRGGQKGKRPTASVPQKTKKTKPARKKPTAGKSQRKPKVAKQVKSSKQGSKSKKVANKKKVPPKTPLLKPVVTTPSRKPALKIPSPAKTKPSFQKPVRKTKKKVVKQETPEDDPFNFGSSNAQEHSDHHIHHHDHLEAHKHHHKHKESHAHDHAHANDHVHNHKHTHNHVHNHIHKHNEAHEHTAEHAHTEKHTHKHLEYIDQGSWRRRDQEQYGEELVPQELLLQERQGRNDPRSSVKQELQKFIESYQAYSSPGQPELLEPARAEPAQAQPYQATDAEYNHRLPEEEDYRLHRDATYKEEMQEPQAVVSPLEGKSPYPVEVEEISYDEYLKLQEMGPTFEEELGDYEDYQSEQSNTFANYPSEQSGMFEDYPSEQSNAFDDSFSSYDMGEYGPMDQASYGTEEHVVMPEYEGDWVDMDMDLQYDLGPEYLDYQELERKSPAPEGRALPDYVDFEGPSLPDFSKFEAEAEAGVEAGVEAKAEAGVELPFYGEVEGGRLAEQGLEGRSLDYEEYQDYQVNPGSLGERPSYDDTDDHYGGQLPNIEDYLEYENGEGTLAGYVEVNDGLEGLGDWPNYLEYEEYGAALSQDLELGGAPAAEEGLDEITVEDLGAVREPQQPSGEQHNFRNFI